MKNFAIGGVNEHFNYPWRKGIEENLFLQAGINLHWQDVPGGTGAMTRMLASGELDFAVMLTEGLLLHAIEQQDIELLQFHVKSPLRWGIHVRKEQESLTKNQLNRLRFAISRYNSGSHLMVSVMAHAFGWEIQDEQFIVVHSLEGGLKALQNNDADVFLWEKYTTAPFLSTFGLVKIDEVPTPWPPFSLAVNKKIHQKNPVETSKICHLICQLNATIKQNFDQSVEIISSRYGIERHLIHDWLTETEWNTQPGLNKEELHHVLHALCKENLCQPEAAQSYESLVLT